MQSLFIACLVMAMLGCFSLLIVTALQTRPRAAFWCVVALFFAYTWADVHLRLIDSAPPWVWITCLTSHEWACGSATEFWQ